jgi:membrane-associated protein
MFNLIGGALWALGITMLGYFLGQVSFIEKNIELAAIVVVAISLTPVALELWKAHKEKQSVAADVAHDLLDPDLDDMAREALEPDGQLD